MLKCRNLLHALEDTKYANNQIYHSFQKKNLATQEPHASNSELQQYIRATVCYDKENSHSRVSELSSVAVDIWRDDCVERLQPDQLTQITKYN